MDILVVENDEEGRIDVSKTLINCGHRVMSGRNLEEARGLLGCLRFDVLVSDISLPDGSGLELMAEGEKRQGWKLSLIHISEPTRLLSISYAVFCLKKK